MQCNYGGTTSFLKTLFLFTIVLVLAACQKDHSFEKNNSLAVIDSAATYNLVASAGNCSDATVTGDIVSGTTLTASFLMVTINVTEIGNWQYTTPTVNGFFFTGSGNFTVTGSQTVFLVASGKPVAVGISTFPLKMGSSNCSVSVSVIPAGTTGVVSGDIYYKATIGGVNYNQSVTASNGFIGGSGLAGQDDVEIAGSINYDNPPLPLGLTEMGVTKGIMHNYVNATNADFKAFFAPGNYVFYNTAVSNTDKIVIGWTDTKGDSWSTDAGSKDQTGSTFTIISVTEQPDLTGTYYLKVKMQFNCMLYNNTTGAMKLLTNGEMVAYFGKI